MRFSKHLLATALTCAVLAGCDRPENPEKTQKDVAEEAAEGQKKVGEAQKDAAEASAKRTEDETADAVEGAAKDQFKIQMASVESAYSVAKEKCDASAGAAKDACLSKAKGDYEVAVEKLKQQRDSMTK